MASFLIIIFYVSLLTIGLLTVLLVCNVSGLFYWLWQIKFNNSNTQFESRKISRQKRPIVINLVVIIVITVGILLYHSPIEFMRIVGNNESIQAVGKIYVHGFGNEASESKEIVAKNQIEDVLSILNEHTYRRNALESRFGNIIKMLKGEESISLSIYTSDIDRSTTLSITDKGYIYNSDTGLAYKIIAEDEREIFYKLKREISRID